MKEATEKRDRENSRDVSHPGVHWFLLPLELSVISELLLCAEPLQSSLLTSLCHGYDYNLHFTDAKTETYRR